MLQKHGHILKKANFPIKIHCNNSFSRNKFEYSTDPGECIYTIFKQFSSKSYKYKQSDNVYKPG